MKELLDKIEAISADIRKITERVDNKFKAVEEVEKKVKDLEALYEKIYQQKAVAAYDGPVTKELANVLTRPPLDEGEKRLQELADCVLFAKAFAGNKARDYQIYKEFIALAREIGIKDVLNTSDDSTLFPTTYSWQFFQSMFKDAVLLNIFVDHVMKAKTERFPFPTAEITPYLVGEATTTSGATLPDSSISYSYVDLTAKVFALAAPLSQFSTKFLDSSFLVYLRQEIVKSMRRGIENAIVNGDPDKDYNGSSVADNDVRKAFKGLRYYAHETYSTAIDVSSYTNLSDIHAALVKKIYADWATPDQLVYIVSPAVYVEMVANSQVATVDKYGAKATLITGELAKLAGVPVIVSSKVPANLNASGKYDGSTTTKSIIILAVPKRFVLGRVGNVEVFVESEPRKDLVWYCVKAYPAFVALADSSHAPVALGYNWDIS